MASPTEKPRNDVNEIIQKELWSDLSTLFQDGGLSDAEKCVAVEAASKHCAESIFLSLISPHCTSSQLHSALPHLASRGLWQAVGHVLQRGVSTALLTWSVHQAARQSAEQELLSLILPHCAEDQLDSVLAVLVKRGLWRAVGVVIQQVQGTTRRWAIEKACQVAGEHELVVFILPACSAVEIACVIAQVVARGLWGAVGEMLQRGVSDTLYTWALQEAVTQAECEQIRCHLLPHCTRDYLNRFMSYLISTGRWNVVGKLLQCVEEKMSTWSVDGRHVDSKLLSLIVDRNWRGITALLHKAIDDSYSHVETFITEEYEEKTFAYQIFSRTEDGVLEPVTMDNPSCVWRPGGEGFPSCWSHLHSVLVVMCFEPTNSKHLCVHFHCAGYQLGSLITNCVRKCSSKTFTGDIKMMTVDDNVVYFNRFDGDFINEVIVDLLRHVFTINVRWAWCNVLEQGPSEPAGPAMSTETAGFHTNKAVDGEKRTVSETELEGGVSLVARGGWRHIGTMLREGVGDSQHEWLVRKACLLAPERDLVQNVLPHCSDRLLDSVLTVMVGRGAWWAVAAVLGRGVSDSKKRWAVLAAYKYYKKNRIDCYVADCILPHCADDMIDSVVTILAERHQWRSAINLLERDVSDCKKRWVVQKACEDIEKGLFKEYFPEDGGSFINIVRYCADDQLKDVLDVGVKRRQWRNVGEALKRQVSGFAKQRAIEEACARYKDDNDGDMLINYILPHCADAHLQSILLTLIERNLFKSVRYVLRREVADIEHRKFVLTVFVCANARLIEQMLPCYVYDDIRLELETLASRRLWKLFLLLLYRFTIDTLHSWAIVDDCSEPKERVFWDMVSNPCDGVKELSPAQWRSVTWSELQYSLKECLHWDTLLCELLCEALLGTVREIWLSGREKEVDCRSHTAIEEAKSVTEDVHQQLNNTLIACKYSAVSALLPCIYRLCQKYAGKAQKVGTLEPPAGKNLQRHGSPAENSSYCTHHISRNPEGELEKADRYGENETSSSPLFELAFLKYLTRKYYKRKAWTQMTDAVLVVLTTTPVVPGVQSVALRIMVREKRWDVIRHACLSCVCEQDRRQVFQAAVKQRQWGAVKRWADYSLYDDQRLWALGEAKGEKRSDVYLKLAGHGLNEGERMGVLYRVAMHADWKLVRHMVNTVADVSHMKDLLTNTRPARQSRPKPSMFHQRVEQLTEFEEALKKKTNTLKTLKTAANRGKWQVVLYNIRHKPDLQHARRALKAAVSSQAWQAVIQLVRLETDVTRRDSLFRDMVRQRQWAVCRELLDLGVSDDLCVEALNDLMDHRQWTLVAMVMRCPMSEERRTEMMYRALMMREGSVVWQCINSLQRPLSSEQRENIFQLAFSREVWQAVKPLVEKKDKTGIRHRDTALLEAIEQHQWDVVDHCQRHHADINMKDDDGHTPIHRAARKGDWEAVKELTVRDGDPNLLDSECYSVLHRAIIAKQWDLVKLLIQFHGDIHRPSRGHRDTALNMLIDARQIDVIQSTFMWCADQWKGVNDKGETTLHAACLSGSPGILHDLIARKVDPLALTYLGQTFFFSGMIGFRETNTGLSPLCYAVLCRDCPQKMVAECIKLGFSTHGSHFTCIDERPSSQMYFPQAEKEIVLTCPIMLSVKRDLPVVTQMLYESGACSNRQLFNLSAYLDAPTLSDPMTRLAVKSDFSILWKRVHGNGDGDDSFDTVLMKKSADYVRQMSSTPRSLVSTCRLVISRCLTLSKTRHRDIAQLPLSPLLKNYLMFTDLTDPDYVGHQE